MSFQNVEQFAARLNGATSVCDFTVKCSCDKEISYSNKILAFQLIWGLRDPEIQEQIWADTATPPIQCLSLSTPVLIFFKSLI